MGIQILKVLNLFFQYNKYSIHVLYLPPSLPQILDIFTISGSAFKQVKDLKIFRHGIISDHSGAIMKIVISPIKHSGMRLASLTEKKHE